jgi:tight adherence protein C
MSPVILLALLAIGGATTVIVLSLMPAPSTSILEERLGQIAAVDFSPLMDPVELELQKPITERIIAPFVAALGRWVARRTKTAQLEALRLKLLQAGSQQRAETLLAMRVILLPVGAGLGVGLVMFLNLTGGLAIMAPVVLALLGFMYPTSSLSGKIKKRTKEIRYALPGVLDLLTICMEAGLSLDMAILRVSEADESILAHEFRTVLNEVRLGRPRGEALMALAERNVVDELSTFVRAMVQAEPLGISVAGVLRIQSEELRRLRKQRAENAGHRAPVLMLLPMMGCIFPCIFVCLLGPAVLTIVSPAK